MRVLICLFIVISFLNISQAQNFLNDHKVSSVLKQTLDQRDDEWISINIVLDQQIDYESWVAKHDIKNTSVSERATALIYELKAQAEASQGNLLRFLNDNALVDQTSIRKYWIANAIVAKVKKNVVYQLAERTDVRFMAENLPLIHTKYEIVETSSAVAPDNIEKGLAAIHAPEMWALGYTGYGRVAFTADTGVDPTHPAISNNYNGLYRPIEQSWYEYDFGPNPGNTVPFDCGNHGTHVTGTIVGLDRKTNDTIGVAFNATWTGGAILCGIGTADNIDAFQWALDPDNNPDTTDDMPDVINNSWRDPGLAEMDCFSVYVPILEALEAAGVAVVFSAGNEGPEPNTITPPHNININEVNVFAVGALNGNVASFPIANFSSIGPSHCPGEGSLKIKPEVSAPGVQVRSCIPGPNYALFNGTSMAAPHVSGAILLLKEAFPYLGGKDLKLALYHSCTDLGPEGEDNTFGMGIINVYAAYQYLIGLGHTPVDPNVANDVMLLEVKHAIMGCESSINPYILIENAGLDTLTTLDIYYGNQTFANNYQWTGALPSKGRIYIQLPAVTLPVGNVDIEVRLTLPNGQEDAKPLNNSKKLNINITERLEQVNNFVLNQNICKDSKYFVQSPAVEGKYHTTRWYNEPFDGDVVYDGNVILMDANLNVPALFAEVEYKEYTGIIGIDINKGQLVNQKQYGLVFDVHTPMILKSVKIYGNAAHREFFLYDENGEAIYKTPRGMPRQGEFKLILDWKLEPGKNYRIVKNSGAGLFTQNQDVNFPYIIDDIVTVHSGINGDSISNEYHHFFDWEVSYIEPCGRVPYFFDVRTDSAVGILEFNLSTDTLRLPNQPLLLATSTSQNIATYLWNMGDGSSYETAEVEHEYQKDGIYNIELQVIDDNQCLLAAKSQITVLDVSSVSEDIYNTYFNDISVYPNPVNDVLFIDYNGGLKHDLELVLLNAQGVQLKSVFIRKGTKSFELSTQNLPKGVYFLQNIISKYQYTYKVVKI